MAGEIFISYRRADQVWARLLHSQLQAEGVEAWYDAQVGAGQDWRSATTRALKASRIFVLLFSSNAAQSTDVAKELAAAVFEKKLIIPVRLEDISPDGAFLYELASRNWVNAYEDTEAKLTELAKGLAQMVRSGTQDESVLPFDRSDEGRIRSSQKQLRKPVLIAAAATVMAAAAALFLLYSRPAVAPASPTAARVAVLPFDTTGTGKDLRGVADVIFNEIVNQLSNSQVQVISPAQSKAVRGGDAAAIDRLGADMVLDGTMQGDGKAIDVSVHLDDVREHVVLWSGEFHGNADAIAALEASIATQIADVLYWTKTGRSGNVRLDASTLAIFIAGRESSTGARNAGEGVGLSDYRKVVAASPDFSWGHSGVAHEEAIEVMVHPASHNSDALRADALLEAKRALALEPHNGEAWTARAFLAPPLDWQGRESLLLQGIAADPNSELNIIMEGNLLGAVGRGRDALVWFKRAHAIDPVMANENGLLALYLALEGYLTENRAVLAQMALQGPDFASTWRFRTNVGIGAADNALAQLADPAARPSGMDQKSIDAWSAALKVIASKDRTAKAGAVKAVMEASTGSLGRGSALMLLAMLGDLDGAFAQAQFYKPVVPSSPPYLFLPTTAAMRSDPRFMPLARNLGLVDYWRSTGQWPDFCSEPGLPYDCRKEAERIAAAK